MTTWVSSDESLSVDEMVWHANTILILMCHCPHDLSHGLIVCSFL
jgi:hypothetical protein